MSAKKRGNSGVPLYHPPGARFQTGNRVYKIVMLGQGGVGKSALTLQFVTHKFQEDHDPTIEDAYQKRAVIDGVPFVLDVLDTAGQDEFTAMREQYMRGGEGFLMVYSVTNKRSFYELRRFKETVNRVRHSVNVPIVVVGNKCDLKSKIEVPIEEGQALGKEFNCPFFETSAALRLNVDESFHEIVRCIQRQELRDYNEGLGGSTSQVGDDKKSNGPSSAGLACCLRPQTDS